MISHRDACLQGRARYLDRKANELLSDAYRDKLILRAIDAGCDYAGIRDTLNQARADIADGVTDSEGRLCWAY